MYFHGHVYIMFNGLRYIMAVSFIREKFGVPGENYRPAVSHNLHHIMLHRVHLA